MGVIRHVASPDRLSPVWGAERRANVIWESLESRPVIRCIISDGILGAAQANSARQTNRHGIRLRCSLRNPPKYPVRDRVGDMGMHRHSEPSRLPLWEAISPKTVFFPMKSVDRQTRRENRI